MKKKVFGIITALVVALSSIIAGCGSDGGGGGVGSGPPIGPPVNNLNSVDRFLASMNGYSGQIMYSYTYEDLDVYYIYLGELRNVPSVSFSHQYHDGVVGSTYTVTITESFTNSIETQVANSSQTAVNTVKTITASAGAGGNLSTTISAKAGVGPFVSGSTKTSANAYWNTYAEYTDSSIFQKTTSLTQTVANASSYAKSTMEARSFDLTKDTKAGYYRYGLFSVSDVYLYVVKDNTTGNIEYEFRENVKPGGYFWALDYSETSDFDKNNESGFVLDPNIVDSLPKPTIVLIDPPAGKVFDIQFSAGGNHSLAIDGNGNLWAWGRNNFGQLGNNDTSGADQTSPVHIMVGKKFIAVSAGYNYSFAIDEDGKLYAWGYNAYGQLGDGTTDTRYAPVPIKPELKFITVSTARKNSVNVHTLAIDEDGKLYAWGDNSQGQLGRGNTDSVNIPLWVQQAYTYKAVSAGGEHSLAIDTAGKLYAWGGNSYGQLGDGTTGGKSSRVAIEPTLNFTAVSAGINHSLAIEDGPTGQLYAWGWNAYGQLGDGTAMTNRWVPKPIDSGTVYKKISAGSDHSLGIDAGGNLYAWGSNSSGQLGISGNTQYNAPQLINLGTTYSAISAGQIAFSLILRMTDDMLFGMGYNTYGQLGIGNTDNQSTPTQVQSLKHQ